MAGDKARGAKVSLPERFKLKEKSIGTTAERLAEVQSEKHYILILADIGNSDIVFVGDEERQVIPLLAGGFILLYSDLYDVYVKAELGTQKIYFIAQKDKAIIYSLGKLYESSTNPNLRMSIWGAGNRALVQSGGSDNVDTTKIGLIVESMKYLFNEIGWDRERGNYDLTLLASAKRTVTTTSADQINYNCRGVLILFKITARTVGVSPLINFIIQYKTPDGSYADILRHTNFDPTVAWRSYLVYPGATDILGRFNKKNDVPLPRIWRVKVEFVQDVTDLTYSVMGLVIR